MAKRGRHGGNHNEADEFGNDKDPSRLAARNTDVDSRAANRNSDRSGGRKLGER